MLTGSHARLITINFTRSATGNVVSPEIPSCASASENPNFFQSSSRAYTWPRPAECIAQGLDEPLHRRVAAGVAQQLQLPQQYDAVEPHLGSTPCNEILEARENHLRRRLPPVRIPLLALQDAPYRLDADPQHPGDCLLRVPCSASSTTAPCLSLLIISLSGRSVCRRVSPIMVPFSICPSSMRSGGPDSTTTGGYFYAISDTWPKSLASDGRTTDPSGRSPAIFPNPAARFRTASAPIFSSGPRLTRDTISGSTTPCRIPEAFADVNGGVLPPAMPLPMEAYIHRLHDMKRYRTCQEIYALLIHYELREEKSTFLK